MCNGQSLKMKEFHSKASNWANSVHKATFCSEIHFTRVPKIWQWSIHNHKPLCLTFGAAHENVHFQNESRLPSPHRILTNRHIFHLTENSACSPTVSNMIYVVTIGIASPALSVRRGKVKDLSRFLSFLPEFSSFLDFHLFFPTFGKFFAVGGTLPHLDPPVATPLVVTSHPFLKWDEVPNENLVNQKLRWIIPIIQGLLGYKGIGKVRLLKIGRICDFGCESRVWELRNKLCLCLLIHVMTWLTWLMSSGVLELLWPSKASYPALLFVPPMSPVQCHASGHLHMWGVVYLAFFFHALGSSGLVLILACSYS